MIELCLEFLILIERQIYTVQFHLQHVLHGSLTDLGPNNITINYESMRFVFLSRDSKSLFSLFTAASNEVKEIFTIYYQHKSVLYNKSQL